MTIPSYENTVPQPQHRGLYIHSEILEIKGLTPFDRLLLAWIDAYYYEEKGGCFASNDHLATKMDDARPNRVAKSISKLRKAGLIIDISFDGRQRVIRAAIGRTIETIQQQKEKQVFPLGKSSDSRTGKRVTPSPYTTTEESTKYIGGEPPIPRPLTSSSKNKSISNPKKIERMEYIFTTDEEHQKLLEEYGEDKTKILYQKLNDWKEDTPRAKWKKNDSRTILRWVINAVREDEIKNKKEGTEISVDIHGNSASASRLNRIYNWPESKNMKVESRGVEIWMNNRKEDFFKYTDANFINIINNKLKTWGVKVQI